MFLAQHYTRDTTASYGRPHAGMCRAIANRYAATPTTSYSFRHSVEQPLR